MSTRKCIKPQSRYELGFVGDVRGLVRPAAHRRQRRLRHSRSDPGRSGHNNPWTAERRAEDGHGPFGNLAKSGVVPDRDARGRREEGHSGEKAECPAGVLYIVATPIGNLGDISERALQILNGVDAVLAEDTRHSRRLLRAHGLETPLRTLHEHNERRMAARIVQRLESGERLALVCDAGTPLISDPGFHLVRRVRDAGCEVVPIPGPCALVCALSAAGLPTDRFVFEGFLPVRPTARRRRLHELQKETRTLVFYEAPHRIGEMLADLAEAFGGTRGAVLAKELTKVHERIRHGTLDDLRNWLGESRERTRGEFVILVGGAPEEELPPPLVDDHSLLRELLKELPVKRAVDLVHRLTRRERNRLYRQALEITREGQTG